MRNMVWVSAQTERNIAIPKRIAVGYKSLLALLVILGLQGRLNGR